MSVTSAALLSETPAWLKTAASARTFSSIGLTLTTGILSKGQCGTQAISMHQINTLKDARKHKGGCKEQREFIAQRSLNISGPRMYFLACLFAKIERYLTQSKHGLFWDLFIIGLVYSTPGIHG